MRAVDDTDPTMTATWERLAIVYQALMAIALAFLLAAALHAAAIANVSASRRLSSPPAKLAAAKRGAFIEPWNDSFKTRVATLQAEQLLKEGRPARALQVLRPFEGTTEDHAYTAIHSAVIDAVQAGGSTRPDGAYPGPPAP